MQCKIWQPIGRCAWAQAISAGSRLTLRGQFLSQAMEKPFWEQRGSAEEEFVARSMMRRGRDFGRRQPENERAGVGAGAGHAVTNGSCGAFIHQAPGGGATAQSQLWAGPLAVITPRRCPYVVRDVTHRRSHSHKTDRPESPRRKCRHRRARDSAAPVPSSVTLRGNKKNNNNSDDDDDDDDIMKVSSIDGRRLRRIIRKESASCLVVDCRPYFSFTSSSVRGSVNVNLNSVVVRRSRGGPVPLQFVIPDERALLRLREGSISAIVALDDRTSHWQKLKKDSVAQIVINTLSHLASGANICFLKGGYENFHSQYPELCTEVKTIDQSGTETEKIVNTHCEKLSVLKPDYDQGKPVEILPFLYLGSAYHASRQDYLSDLHITALLNVSRRDMQPAKGHYDYKWIPVEDNHMADISSHFQEAIEFIDHVKQSGGKVLVHCEAGISRSPTICMAYIMRTQQLQLDAAFDIIKQRRDVVSPNFSFMGQLLQFESEVLSMAPAHAATPEPATPCVPESASFFANDFAATFNTKNFEPSVITLPTSYLQSPVHHQFKLSPITALP
uniref:Dual specificity protein phosphatase 5 n=1 Tax=Scophthalmus maximus TaxID=52904 RepID=A0A8D2ZHQ1_SCOMX